MPQAGWAGAGYVHARMGRSQYPKQNDCEHCKVTCCFCLLRIQASWGGCSYSLVSHEVELLSGLITNLEIHRILCLNHRRAGAGPAVQACPEVGRIRSLIRGRALLLRRVPEWSEVELLSGLNTNLEIHIILLLDYRQAGAGAAVCAGAGVGGS